MVEGINELLGIEFIIEWNGMCNILGLDGDPRMHMGLVSEKVLKCVWQKRRRLIGNDRNEVRVLQNEHYYYQQKFRNSWWSSTTRTFTLTKIKMKTIGE